MSAEMSRESRAMLLNVLWHHQGGSSPVGQPIRALLGIGQHAHLTDEHVSEAKWIDKLLADGVRASPAGSCGARATDQGQCLRDGVAESVLDTRNGNADWTKAGTGVNSPTSPGSISRKASTGSAGSNPAAVAPPPSTRPTTRVVPSGVAPSPVALKAALQAALPVLQDYASSNPMHFYRGAWHDPRGVHAAVKLVTAALGVGEATMADELTVEQKRVANVWDHIDDVLPVIEAARAGKWTPYENMACKYIELRIDMRDGGCIIKNAKGERINPSDLRRQPYGHGFEPWPKGRPPLATWQRETIAAMAAPDGAQEVPRD